MTSSVGLWTCRGVSIRPPPILRTICKCCAPGRRALIYINAPTGPTAPCFIQRRPFSGATRPTMRATLLAVAAILAVCSTAKADTLPARFYGEWCGIAGSDEGMQRTSKPCKDDYVVITAKRVQYSDGTTCTIAASANYKPRNPSFRNTYYVRLVCSDPSANDTYYFSLIESA
jgi:hypothetical protein